jgi:hypothetical protein
VLAEVGRDHPPTAFWQQALPEQHHDRGSPQQQRIRTNSTTMLATIAKVIEMLLKLFAPNGLLLSLGTR